MERVHMNGIQEIMYRLRKGQSVEAIHRDTGHAKKTIRKYRELAKKHGFLEKERGLPVMSELAEVLGPVKHLKQSVSTVEPYKEVVQKYLDQGETNPASDKRRDCQVVFVNWRMLNVASS